MPFVNGASQASPGRDGSSPNTHTHTHTHTHTLNTEAFACARVDIDQEPGHSAPMDLRHRGAPHPSPDRGASS
jgi:hypothetical protein